MSAAQHGLLAALKAKRLQIAKAQKLAPFMIFHDSVLIEIARRRPRTGEEMQAIPGIGPSKIERFGEIFLAVVASREGGA